MARNATAMRLTRRLRKWRWWHFRRTRWMVFTLMVTIFPSSVFVAPAQRHSDPRTSGACCSELSGREETGSAGMPPWILPRLQEMRAWRVCR